MRLLMHLCCSNCSLYPVKTLSSRGIDITGLWFNPNIHPYTEYHMRLKSVQELQKKWGLSIEYADHYGLKEFVRSVVNHEDRRCTLCYSMRLEKTAIMAKEMGLDGFTTSLLVSPYQKFDIINSIGREMGDKYSIPFYSDDFRPGWKEGMGLSKALGLYRQKYCGCIYSEMERYLKKSEKLKT